MNLENAKVVIEYNNDKEAANKIIGFIISFLVENNYFEGEDSYFGSDFGGNEKI